MGLRRRYVQKLLADNSIILPSGIPNAKNEVIREIKALNIDVGTILMHISNETDRWIISDVHKLYAKEPENRKRVEEIGEEAKRIQGDVMIIRREIYQDQELISKIEADLPIPKKQKMGF